MNEGRINEIYDEKTIRSNRTFPTGKTIALVVIALVQVLILVLAFSFEPKPQDEILSYDVTVIPRDDGSLDIQYSFVWKALDPTEDLTWVEIGMANEHYTVDPVSLSPTITNYTQVNYDGEVYLQLDLDHAYSRGDIVEFSFRVNQRNMLCKDDSGYFYEFVPCWFNAAPIERYTFRWENSDSITGTNAEQHRGLYYAWSGSLDCGEYAMMQVHYSQAAFDGCHTVSYEPFNDNNVENTLQDDKIGFIILAIFGALLLVIAQVWIIDSVVSYHRGRGFLTGHGYHIHTFGRSNPHYIRARNKYNAQHAGRSGGRSGGCACACACACAGGGRAGCSQKDTYALPPEQQTDK